MSGFTPLPVECIHEIISHLFDDPDALNRCIRTNRLFARLTAPILYKNPWRFFGADEEEGEIRKDDDPRGKLLIRTYINCLDKPLLEFVMTRAAQTVTCDKAVAAIVSSIPTPVSSLLDYIAYTRDINLPIIYRFIEAECLELVPFAGMTNMIQDSFTELSKAFAQRCSNVETFVSCWHVNTEILKAVISRFPNLCRLDLLKYEATNEILDLIAKNCRRLQEFRSMVKACSAASLSSVIEAQEDGYLKEFCIRVTTSPRVLLTTLSAGVIAKITDLRINIVSILDVMDGMNFANLRSLDLSECLGVIDTTFDTFIFGQMFSEVNLSETKVTEEAIIALAKHCNRNLKKLVMLPCGAADSVEEGIRALAEHCPNLVEFRLDVIRAELRSIIELIKACRNMSVLVIGGVDINSEDDILDRVVDAIGTNLGNTLSELDVRDWAVSDETIVSLAGKCTNLTKLTLKYCRYINDGSIKELCKHLAGKLRFLDISKCPDITIETVGYATNTLIGCRIVHCSG
ncbi:6111_t:CDS:1 [Paraglomus brasilianum]|uniref:6111_t:CDS:1 n=1 Tax=Paraglomus brasilianum TaxID=144538 RepID=A0A9N9FS79_9GLOM|nr:6111_t:CDS:1 [Paraglomus brasilianum]